MIPGAFSQACENNKRAIGEVLKTYFCDCHTVLEIGSGTGQHAVYMARLLSHLRWLTSDREENHQAIEAWLAFQPSDNLAQPIALDVAQKHWPCGFDAVFSANTVHIMSWELAHRMISQVATLLPSGGVFALYGPFNYGGTYTSESNAEFDQWLKSVCKTRGIRDFEEVNKVASQSGLSLLDDVEMPANNRMLVWQKAS